MPVILKPLQYANTATWNGSGTATVTVDFGFQPDLVWIKPRNNVASNANSHILIDSVRGSNKVLRSDTTGAEVTESNNITAFTSTGITIGDSHNVNKNTTSQYVAWAWKKGATQGFDIVTYTGTGVARTVSHSLGVAPKMMIVKTRSAVSAWVAYHASLGTGKVMVLNGTNAVQSLANYWDTAPDSSNITLGSNADVNANAATFVAYLFSEVAGFSKFGSYTGNGSADGPFVFCGFRPAFVLIKQSSAAGQSWQIQDSTRESFNDGNRSVLFSDTSGVEITDAFPLDFLSNGFKVRNAGNGNNASGATYIFAAFSEFPFKNALAR